MGLLAEPDGSADLGMHLSHLVNQRQMSILAGEKARREPSPLALASRSYLQPRGALSEVGEYSLIA